MQEAKKREEGKGATYLLRMPGIDRQIIITRGDLIGGQEIMGFEGVGFSNVLKRFENGSLKYIVNEWILSEREKIIVNLILSDIMRFQEYYYDDLVAGKIDEIIERVIRKYRVQEEFRLRRERLLYYVQRDTIGFGLIQPLIYDPEITDIDIKGTDPVRVKMRRFAGRWVETNVSFPDELNLKQFVSRIASLYGRGISEATPLVSFVYKSPDERIRFRVAASYGGIKSEVTTAQVRKFPEKPLLFNDLIRFGSLSAEAAAAIWMMVDYKGKIAFSGPVGTGKTTLLNAALAMFDPRKKLVTVEDIEELALRFKGNSWVPYYARGGEFYEIVRFALRITPDLLILAEVLGKELGDVLASQTGHGLAFTIHANTVEEFNLRFRMLLRMYYGEQASEDLMSMTIRELWSLLFLNIREDRRILDQIYMVDIRNGNMVKVYQHPFDFNQDEFVKQLAMRTNYDVETIERDFLDRIEFLTMNMDRKLEELYEELIRWYNAR
ncbi:MAG: type II/IV secretion system ATPase subunit [Candidatus Korarchaeum sp.]